MDSLENLQSIVPLLEKCTPSQLQRRLKAISVEAALLSSAYLVRFGVREVRSGVVFLRVTLECGPDEPPIDRKRLIRKARNIFKPFIHWKSAELELIPDAEPTMEIVNRAWVTGQIERFALSSTDIARETGVPADLIQRWLGGEKHINSVARALFYYYFLSKRDNVEDASVENELQTGNWIMKKDGFSDLSY